MRPRLGIILTTTLLLAACGRGHNELIGPQGSPPTLGRSTPSDQPSPDAAGTGATGTGATRIDPRQGGLEVGLGEWAVTLEADAIRPGRVTFVVANHGTMDHGYEIQIEGVDGDHSGSGGGDDEDGIKAETSLLAPGQSRELTLDLPAGLYKVECLVPGHDDMGMEALLRVTPDAPLVRAEDGTGGTGGSATDPAVAIEGFAFQPASLDVEVGTTVTWTNHDGTEHTVTAEDGSFGSDPLASRATYETTFGQAGTFAYLCAIHPSMEGTITVAG